MAHEEQPSSSNPRENERPINRRAADRVHTVAGGMPPFLPLWVHQILDNASVRLAEELLLFYGEDENGVDEHASGWIAEIAGDYAGDLGARIETISGHGYSYAHARRLGIQQSDPTGQARAQAKYMNCMASRIPAPDQVRDELQAKERLRVRLIGIAQKALESYAQEIGCTISSKAVVFNCCGSLRNGFMLPKAGLDLVAKIHSSTPSELVKACPRVFEKAFLQTGLGASLTSNPKGCKIKLCDEPSAPFLAFLRNQSCMVEHGRAPPMIEMPFPPTGAGARCAIDFTGRLKVYTAQLLRCYTLCDERVRQVGIFVKLWAQNREIDGIHNGTLCSHGYVLMAIHYLMNVAQPPVLPNLQTVEGLASGHIEVAHVDGHAVRFFNDEAELRAMSKRKGPWKNTQSVGELLCGFFAYYSMRKSNSRKGCFNWAHETISIRSTGGIRHKRAKDWHMARTDADGYRHRYLLAIEDPFVLDHNVASAVTHNGLSVIKSEFRRAHTIISRVRETPGSQWEWRTNEGDVGKDLLAKGRPRLSLMEMSNNQWNHADCVPELCTRANQSAPAPTQVLPTQVLPTQVADNHGPELPETVNERHPRQKDRRT